MDVLGVIVLSVFVSCIVSSVSAVRHLKEVDKYVNDTIIEMKELVNELVTEVINKRQ